MPSDPADFDAVLEETRRGLAAFVQGDASVMKSLFSRTDDVVLANPLGPPAQGPTAVDNTLDRAAAFFRGGTVEFDEIARRSTSDLGYVFQIERAQGKVGESEELRRIALRVTMIYHREPNGWKLIHRQADPIVTPRPIESVFEDGPPPSSNPP